MRAFGKRGARDACERVGCSRCRRPISTMDKVGVGHENCVTPAPAVNPFPHFARQAGERWATAGLRLPECFWKSDGSFWLE